MSFIDRSAGPFLKKPKALDVGFGPAPLRGLAGQRLGVTAWSVRETALAILCLAGFAVVAQSFWWLSASVVPWDSKNHFYPMFRFLADSLQHGEIPLWNPYHF